MLHTLPSEWNWLALAGDPALGIPLPPGSVGREWADHLRSWNNAGRPWPAGPAATSVLRLALGALRSEQYLGSPRSLITRTPLSSRVLPGKLRLTLHQLLSHPDTTDLAAGPCWPSDNSGNHLGRLFECEAAPSIPRLALTHDLDSPASFPIAHQVAAREAALGHRATYFLVGRDLRRAAPLITRLRELGHEVGLHGLLHDFRLGRLRGRALDRRVGRLIHLARTHDIDGFRSPALLSSQPLRTRLAPAFRYDSSLPTSDRQSLVGPVRGCSTTEPYLLDGLIEIPISAPLEDRLILMGYRPRGIFELYEKLWAQTRTRKDLLVIGYHLEPHLGGSPAMIDQLQVFLERTSDTPSVGLGSLA